jgi:general stress protein 26
MEQTFNSDEAVKKFKELVEDVNVCMFTTIDDHLQLHSRPMSTVHIDYEGDAWFFTNEFSEKIQDATRDNSVYLIYSHPGKNIYVSVKGVFTVIVNRQRIEELWSPMLKAWFPGGTADPKLCLIKVTTIEAEYWNSSSNKMAIYFKMLKAIAMREKYTEEESGKLKL